MKIGYPCISNSIPRNAPSTFRLASYSENRLVQTLKNNLIHLNRILKYNAVYNTIETVKESSSLQEPEDDKFYTNPPNVILKYRLQDQEIMVAIILKFTTNDFG